MAVCYNKNARNKPWTARYRDVVQNKRISLGSFETREEAQKVYMNHIEKMKSIGIVNQRIERRRSRIDDGYATATQLADMYGIEINISRMLGTAGIKKKMYRDIFIYEIEASSAFIRENMPKIIAKTQKEMGRLRKQGRAIEAEDRFSGVPSNVFFSLPPLDDFKKVAKEFRDSSIWQ